MRSPTAKLQKSIADDLAMTNMDTIVPSHFSLPKAVKRKAAVLCRANSDSSEESSDSEVLDKHIKSARFLELAWRPYNERCTNIDREDTKEHVYFGVDSTVQRALGHIRALVDADFQVGPLVLLRMSRGGKTAVLRGIFDRLSEDPSYYPIIVCATDCTVSGQDPLTILIKSIALQLLHSASSQHADDVECTEALLVDRLNHIQENINQSIVLCIDDLDVLEEIVYPRVVTFLANTFLDVKGRYLVYSSCVALRLGSPSDNRKHYYLRMPFCVNKVLLRTLPHAEGITDLLITLNAGIPSLTYLFLNQWSYPYNSDMLPRESFLTTMERKVKESGLKEADFMCRRRIPLMQGFLRTLLTGCAESGSFFSCFAERDTVANRPVLRFPPVYVALILEYLGEKGVTSAHDAMFGAASYVGGQEWTRVVTFAIYTLGLVAKYIPDHNVAHISRDGPFHIAAGGTVTTVTFLDMPADFTLEEAHGCILEQIALLDVGALVIFRRAGASFRLFDFFLIFRGTERVNLHGVKCVLDQEGLHQAPPCPPPSWLDRAWCLRSHEASPSAPSNTSRTASTSNSNNITSSSRDDSSSSLSSVAGNGNTTTTSTAWEFLSPSDVERSLFGFAFQGLRPDRWGAVQEPGANWFYPYEAAALK